MFGKFLTKKMKQVDLYKDLLNFKQLTGFDFYDFIMLFSNGIVKITAPKAHSLKTLKKAVNKLGAKEIIKASHKLKEVTTSEHNRVDDDKKEFDEDSISTRNEE